MKGYLFFLLLLISSLLCLSVSLSPPQTNLIIIRMEYIIHSATTCTNRTDPTPMTTTQNKKTRVRVSRHRRGDDGGGGGIIIIIVAEASSCAAKPEDRHPSPSPY